MPKMPEELVVDPIKYARLVWPDVRFYRRQQDVIYSVMDNYQTYVTAGHMLGKDFVTAFLVTHFFLTRHPVRVVTTSADFSQLESVLWGEMRRFLATAKFAMTADRGGPIIDNHMHWRKIDPATGEECGLSYVRGRVAAKGEGLQGHHIAKTGDGVPRTLFVVDEASGVDDKSMEAAETWADRILVIGNPYPCQNFFRRGVEAGDLVAG